jgi:streptomycin 3"-adenylyltransferase
MDHLKNSKKLPREVIPVLKKHSQILLNSLGEKLTGIYVHGSAAMGSFTFKQSDFDYLAIVSSPLTPKERQKLSKFFLEIYGKDAPGNGIEMSIVVEKFAGSDFRYPTPYEFHMGTKEQVEFHGLPHKTEMTDPDLAAHFTITRQRGICVYGKQIDEVFADIPRKYFFDSIAKDAEESFNNIQEETGTEKCIVPKYAVLNFCRVLAFIEENLIFSKVEGAEWALKNLPEKYFSIISAALQEYRETNSSEKVDPELLKELATFAQTKIQNNLKEFAAKEQN